MIFGPIKTSADEDDDYLSAETLSLSSTEFRLSCSEAPLAPSCEPIPDIFLHFFFVCVPAPIYHSCVVACVRMCICICMHAAVKKKKRKKRGLFPLLAARHLSVPADIYTFKSESVYRHMTRFVLCLRQAHYSSPVETRSLL